MAKERKLAETGREWHTEQARLVRLIVDRAQGPGTAEMVMEALLGYLSTAVGKDGADEALTWLTEMVAAFVHGEGGYHDEAAKALVRHMRVEQGMTWPESRRWDMGKGRLAPDVVQRTG